MAASLQGSALLLLPLVLAACSKAGTADKRPNALILCGAESLYQARLSGVREGKENTLRDRTEIFIGKLTPKEQQNAWEKVDELADHRADKPLADATSCDALLTASDKDRLEASAAREAKLHGAFRNRQ
jgi:hypothetical protein